MRPFRLRAAVLSAGLCAALSLQPIPVAAQVKKSEMTAAQAAATEKALARGQLMQIYDRAAWITTDDLLEKLPRDRLTDVGGWVVTPTAQGVHIDYIGKDVHAIQAIYSADIADGGRIVSSIVHPADAMPLLGDLARRMQAALVIARQEFAKRETWGLCAQANPNTVVLPPQADGSIPVYFMTPQLDNAHVPFGGHYEIDIAPDGSVAFARAFTNGCLTVEKDASRDAAYMFVSHILDPQPTEIHVFQQIAAGLPIMVGTIGNRLLWRIANGRITLEGELPDR